LKFKPFLIREPNDILLLRLLAQHHHKEPAQAVKQEPPS
jgi:hypothetical protein